MSAQRSVRMTLYNETSQAMHLLPPVLSRGVWGTPPPSSIAANSSATWESESQRFLTGVQGVVTYQIEGEPFAFVTMSWDNPFFAAGVYPPATINHPDYSVGTDIVQDGKSAAVVYTLMRSGTADSSGVPESQGAIFTEKGEEPS